MSSLDSFAVISIVLNLLVSNYSFPLVANGWSNVVSYFLTASKVASSEIYNFLDILILTYYKISYAFFSFTLELKNS